MFSSMLSSNMKLFLESDAPNNHNFVAKFENVKNLSVAPISQLSNKVQITVIFRVCRVQRCGNHEWRSFIDLCNKDSQELHSWGVVSLDKWRRIMTIIVISCCGDFTDPIGSGA